MGSYLAFAMMSQLCYWYSMLEEYVPSAALLFKWQPKVRKKNSRRNTKDTDRDTDNPEETQRKCQIKNFNLKRRYCFLKFSYEQSIHNLCDFPNSCLNNLVNPHTLSDARRTFFKRWSSIANFELFSVVFRSWEFVFSKFEVNRVLFLRRNVLVSSHWCFAENRCRKITGFVKNSKEEYGYYGSSINFFTTTYSGLLTYDISENQLWVCRIVRPK